MRQLTPEGRVEPLGTARSLGTGGVVCVREVYLTGLYDPGDLTN